MRHPFDAYVTPMEAAGKRPVLHSPEACLPSIPPLRAYSSGVAGISRSENGEYRCLDLVILAPWYSIPMLVFARCAPAIGASTDGFSWPSPRPGSIAVRSVRCARRSARTCASFRARRRRRARASGPACAAARSGRPALPPSTPRAGSSAPRSPASKSMRSRTPGSAILRHRLGISDRHLRRVTEAELGVSPIELAQTQRLLLAKRLLSETSLNLTEIAFASGFGSLRRFNALFKSRYGLSPRAAARASREPRAVCAASWNSGRRWRGRACSRTCACAPFRASSGWTRTHYRRTVAIDETEGWIAVSLAKSGVALDVEMSPIARAGDRSGDRAGEGSVRSRLRRPMR